MRIERFEDAREKESENALWCAWEATAIFPDQTKMTGEFDLFPSPPEDYFLRHHDRRWPAWKFGMRQDELFATLAKRCNSISLPVLDVDAFNRDVCDLSATAQDRDEFLHLLEERRDLRQKELLELWQLSFTQLAALPALLASSGTQWKDAVQIYHSHSLDSYVRFFASFLPVQALSPSLRGAAVDTTRPTPPSTDRLTSTPIDSRPETEPSDHGSPEGMQDTLQEPNKPPHRNRRTTKWTCQDRILRRSARIQERCVMSGDVSARRTLQATPRKLVSRLGTVRKGRKVRPR